MAEATGALATGATLVPAATLAGFAGQAAFGAAFRSSFGMTPAQVRLVARTHQPPAVS